MIRALTTLILCASFCAITLAQSDEQTLLKLDQEFISAMLKNDLTALERLVDTGYQGYNQFGQSNDRTAFLTLYKTFQTTGLSTSNVKAKIVGDTALVSGKQRETSTSNFGRDQYLTFLHVWVKRADGWKVLVKQQQFDVAEGTVTPTGWEGGSNTYFLVGTDTTVKHGGNASAFLKSKHNDDRLIATGLSQTLKAEAYRGKRIKLTGYTKGVINYGYAFPWFRINGENGEGDNLGFDNTGVGFFVSPEWRQFSMVLDVPEHGSFIHIGFQLAGRGQVWLDDWKLEIVGKDVPSTNQTPSEANRQAIENFKTRNPAQYAEVVERMKKLLPTLPAAPVNLDFEAVQK